MLKEDTQKHQEDLATYVRKGSFDDTPPGITPDRVFHYRRLVINIVRDGLSRAYPLTKNLLPPKQWDKLVKSFFEEHDCQAYQVWRMPAEFYDYVLGLELELKNKFPFLEELMEFEWTETELYVHQDVDINSYKGLEKGWDSKALVFNPYLSLKSFTYPVHRQNAKYITADKKGRYFLLVYRDIEEAKVHFMDVSAFHVFLVESLYEGSKTLVELLPEAAKLFDLKDLSVLKTEAAKFLENLHSKGVLLGERTKG